MDVYHTCHRTTAEYTVLSSAHGTFPKTDHVPGHTTSLSECKRTKTQAGVFFSCTGEKLDINSEGNLGKPKICGNDTLLNNQ